MCIRDSYKTSSKKYELAEAITHVGDWYLLFDRRRKQAEVLYLQAWELLRDEEDGDDPPSTTKWQASSLSSKMLAQASSLSSKMLARGAFELASTSRYGAASVLVRARDVLTRHVHSSGAAFDLRTDG
mgnify:CR=1 FL=1